MAEKYLGQLGTQRLWERISEIFVHKDGNKTLTDNNFSDADKEKLDSLHNYELPTATADRLGGVKIGDGINVSEDGTISAVITPSAKINWDQVLNTPTTLEGYGITDAATKEELAEVEAKIVGIFHYKGSVATRADLDDIEDPEVGDVYNVLDDGKNFCWDGEAWDDLGGIIDLSGYWSKEELMALTVNEIDVIIGYATNVETLKEILKTGGKVTLADDLVVNEVLDVTKDTVFDLNGNQIVGPNNGTLFNVVGASLTLKNGSINTGRHIAVATSGGKITIENGDYTTNYEGLKAIGEGSELTMNGGTLRCVECGLGVNRGAKLTMNGGSIYPSDNMGIGTNGRAGEGGNTIVMNGGEIVGNIFSSNYEAIGVYIANNDTFVMNGGSIIGNGGAGLVMRAGNVTINNGVIEGRASENRPAGTTGKVADDPTMMTQSAVIYHETANYPGKEGMSLTIKNGVFTGTAHSVEILSNEAQPNVHIEGGEFTPAI